MTAVSNPSSAPAGEPGPDPKLVALLATAEPTRVGRWLRRLLPLVLIAGLGLGIVWWRARSAPKGPKWVTAAVARTDIQVTITATGTLSGLKTVEVGAEVSGKVIELRADYNDHVKRGAVLAVIDPETSKAAVDQAAAQVAEAAAAIRTAKATREETTLALARAEEQAKLGLVSQRDLESARAAAERSAAQLASAEASAVVANANLTSARTRLGKTTIVSPIDGVVLERLVELGQTVTAGFQTPVMFKVTEDLTRMQLTAFVDEADVGRAKEGQRATFTVDAYPNRSFEAKVLAVRNAPRTEQNVVSYESILAVDNASLELRPGMTATATVIADRREEVLAVPAAALRYNPPSTAPKRTGGLFGGRSRDSARSDVPKEPHVWVLEGTTPKVVKVTLGASDGTNTEVSAPELVEGAAVVVDAEEAP
ncbi:MAG: efflux RND transporter periplasmic adaptor subunit [Deltaproteobacteria bacterium]|nr:efflux RND transporter periplasmic adaptor subunit [Deltaproteobacteria bacterium]